MHIPFPRHWLVFQSVVFLAALAAMSLLRGLFYLVNKAGFAGIAQDQLLVAFVHGVRFDASILGTVIAVALIISLPFSFFRPRWSKGIWLGIFGAGLLYILAVSFGDIFYAQYAGKRLSYEVTVFFSAQAWPLVATAASDHPLLFPVAVLAVVGGFWMSYRLYGVVPDSTFTHRWHWQPMGQLLLFVVLVALVARGGTQSRPLRIGDGFVTDNPTVNQLVFNAPFLTVKSLEFSSHNMPRLMENEAAYDLCRDYIGADQGFSAEDYPFQRTNMVAAASRRPNVLVFLLESWSKRYVLDPAYAHLTPNFQRLWHEGLGFTGAYATGTRSPNGVYSVVTGYPDFIHDTVMRRPQLSSDFFSMADMFREHDYETYFIHGGNLDFDNLEGFLRKEGFQHLFGKHNFTHVPSKVWWGTPDGPMYDLAITELAKAPQPFFSLIFTTSTHGPYNVPDDFVPTVEVPDEHPEVGYLRALHYADHELGRFLNELDRAGALRDAVLVFTADHTHHTGLGFLEDKEIPLLVHAPSYGLRGEDPRLASQSDVLPTLAGILGFDEVGASLGRNLLVPASEDRNFVYWISGGAINLRWNNLVATQSEGVTESFRVYDANGGFDPTRLVTDPALRTQMQQRLYAMYECSTRPVLEDRVFDGRLRSSGVLGAGL